MRICLRWRDRALATIARESLSRALVLLEPHAVRRRICADVSLGDCCDMSENQYQEISSLLEIKKENKGRLGYTKIIAVN